MNYSKCLQIFDKCRKHLEVISARRITQSRSHRYEVTKHKSHSLGMLGVWNWHKPDPRNFCGRTEENDENLLIKTGSTFTGIPTQNLTIMRQN
jgi:hypothetical protein